MLPIRKNKEPRGLVGSRAKRASYKSLPKATKDNLRAQLLRDQGYLCCYCMSRIEGDPLSTKIDHWHSQKLHPAEQLEYTNLLVACPGKTDETSHCDSSKGDKDIKFNPCVDGHRLAIHYSSKDGSIRSEDTEFNQQLSEVLNLNCWQLKRSRKEVWDTVSSELNMKFGTRTAGEMEKLLAKWRGRDGEGRLKAYCGVAIHFLQKKLRRQAGIQT